MRSRFVRHYLGKYIVKIMLIFLDFCVYGMTFEGKMRKLSVIFTLFG